MVLCPFTHKQFITLLKKGCQVFFFTFDNLFLITAKLFRQNFIAVKRSIFLLLTVLHSGCYLPIEPEEYQQNIS